MFKPSKKVAAALGVATIAGTAGMFAVAPSASAATTTTSLNMTCSLDAIGLPPLTAEFPFTITAPDKTAPGSVAELTVDMGTTPVPAPLDVEAGVEFDVAFEGTLAGGATGATAIPGEAGTLGKLVGGEPITLPAFKAPFTVPANATGDVDVTITKLTLTAVVPIPCVVDTPAKFLTIGVDIPSNPEPTLQSTPGEVKPGGALTVSGANWPAGTPTVELCDASGAACDATKVTGALTVTDGALAGTATITEGVADGAYQLKVTSGDKSATSNVTVKAETSTGERAISLDPNHGEVGTTVTVTGENYTPGKTLFVLPVNSAQAPAGAISTPLVDAEGKFTTEVVVSDPDTVLIAASEDMAGELSAAAPFTVDVVGPPAQTLDQGVTATIGAGALTITQESGSVALSDVTLNGTDQAMTGALNTVTVKDYRASGTGWTLTGAVTDFTNGSGGTIAAEKFSWTPAVATEGEAPSVPVAGSAGPIGKEGATLASAPNADVTGGTFKADAGLSLAVPAYQAAGNYSGTLTLSLS